MTAATNTIADKLGPFFGVVARGRTYLYLVYNLLALPLGVAYFIFLVVGLSLGLGLLIIWIGVFVLAMLLLLGWALSAFEREQANLLLGAGIEPPGGRPPEGSPVLEWIKAFLGNRVTWTGPVFLFLKFPLGIFSFVFTVTALSVSLALMLAPLYYRWEPLDLEIGYTGWYVDTLPEALLCSLAGIFIYLLALHAVNGLAWVWRELATLLLGDRREAATAADGGAGAGEEDAPAVESAMPEVTAADGNEATA